MQVKISVAPLVKKFRSLGNYRAEIVEPKFPYSLELYAYGETRRKAMDNVKEVLREKIDLSKRGEIFEEEL